MDLSSATAGRLPHGYGASVVFTSGTTGYPKGCLRPEERERARGDELIASYGLGAADVQLIACPLAHSAPGIFARAARAVGAKTWLLPSFRPQSFLAAVEATRTSFAFVVPTQCERLLDCADRNSFAIDSLRSLIVAGAPLPMATKQRLIDWLGPDRLWEFYGSTETGTIAVLAPSEQLSHPGAVGRPPHGVSVQVMADGKALAPGSIGELYVASPTVMLGYEEDGQPVGVRNVDGTLAVTVGDLGFVDADGYVHLVDRKHDTIITGGANVYPAEVERALAGCPGVQGAVVFGIDDPDWGQIVSAVVCVKEVDGELCERDSTAFQSAAAALVESLRAHLAAYKLPRALTFTTPADLPLGSSGKPLRRLARSQFAARLARVDGDRG